jgi:hypothetical protein
MAKINLRVSKDDFKKKRKPKEKSNPKLSSFDKDGFTIAPNYIPNTNSYDPINYTPSAITTGLVSISGSGLLGVSIDADFWNSTATTTTWNNTGQSSLTVDGIANISGNLLVNNISFNQVIDFLRSKYDDFNDFLNNNKQGE